MAMNNKLPEFGSSALGVTGRVALITGGGRNIGRAVALTLAGAGALPVVMYHEDERTARAVCDEISAAGGRAGVCQADLGDVAQIRAVVAKVAAEFGEIDILINNAAIRPHSKISEITVEEWDRVLAVNLRAPFFLAQAVLPAMVHKQWGRIINIGGSDGYNGKPRRAHGVSSKMGLVGLTRALANEVAQFGVTVNIVVPGTIDTKRPHPEWYPGVENGFAARMTRVAMGRQGQSQEVANACLFLASDLATYTTGQEMFVTGGAPPIVRQPEEEYPPQEF
jgi:NAD(P)-dependent dehydrogenase (short-subunit alcohol dehydrogenase family)